MFARRTWWLLLLVLSAPAQAEPTERLQDYVVQPGDSCKSLAERAWGPGGIGQFHRANDLGPLPHRLRPGQVLRLRAAGPDAQLTFVRNQVEAYTPGQHPGHRGEDLLRGHKVSTLEAASAEITFADKSRMQLGEHSLVVVLADSAESAWRRGASSNTTLWRGTLRAHLAELAGDAPVVLDTPAGRVRLGGGQAQIQVDERRTTRLAVYRGRSNLRAQGREVTVKEGFGSRADEGRPPTAPRPLPVAPVWNSPLPALIRAVGETAEATGTYGPGAGGPAAVGYHVQLARDEAFNDLVVDARVQAQVRRLEARGLAPGRYFARVSALDAEQFEGPSGAVARVEVQPAEPSPEPPPAALAAPPPAAPLPVEPPPAALAAPPPAPPRPPAPPPIAPPSRPPAPSRYGLEPGVLGSAICTLPYGRCGGGAGGELGLRIGLPLGVLTAGLRVRYEHVGDELLDLWLPVTYRFLGPQARFSPYAGAAPLLGVRWVDTVAKSYLGAAGFAGGQLRAGPGALFLEVAWRQVLVDGSGALGLSGLLGLLGYRFFLESR